MILYLINRKSKKMLTTTIYKKNIHDLNNYKFKVLKPSTNKKLGKKVLKGEFKDHKFYTLTLVERETCPSDCYHWSTCYGNNMPFAHRMNSSDELLLTNRIHEDIKNLNGKKALIRLHILGDFFSTQYVLFWDLMLKLYKNIAIYGYTANNLNSKIKKSIAIAEKIIALTNTHKKRFSIRFSNDLNNKFSANSFDIVKPAKGESILCPVQDDKTENCGTCGLCWESQERQIIFKTH